MALPEYDIAFVLSFISVHPRRLVVLNKDRSLPERVKAVQRWTIVPTVTYCDIVEYLNTHHKPPVYSCFLSMLPSIASFQCCRPSL